MWHLKKIEIKFMSFEKKNKYIYIYISFLLHLKLNLKYMTFAKKYCI